MKRFYAYVKKELREQVATFKALIIVLLFFLLGVISPIGAKYTTEVIGALSTDLIKLQMPDPTYIDAWAQYFKNISQLGFVVFVIIFYNALGNELIKGTLIIPFSKGLTIGEVINAKFCALIIIWTVSLAVSFFSCSLYTKVFFGDVNFAGVMPLLFCTWLFGVFVIALVICTNVVCKGGYVSLLLIVSCIVVLFLINLIPKIKEYNPLNIVNINVATAISEGVYHYEKSGIVTLVAIVIALMLSNLIVRLKKEYYN
ncbi:MAG: hypothetical protein IJ335_02620 [Lachnospiraceae bacterium]|nr:hypothetical protein [Lachnospiraceae bacterium]